MHDRAAREPAMTKLISTFALILTVSAAFADKPNLVLFYADDLGWGDLSVYNKEPGYFRHTPNIDRIFEHGVRLENYMTHCVCSPSRAGLLTGKHYATVSAGPATGGTLPNDIRNIAKDFRAAGYRTGAFGKWHNGMPNFPADGNGQAFDYNKDRVWNELHRQHTCDLTNGIFDNHKGWEWGDGVNAYGFDRWVGYYNGGGDLFDRYVNWHHDIDWWHDRRYVPDEKGYTTDLITTHAVAFIEQSKGKPFFCYIPHEAVHAPLQVKLADLKALCRRFPGEWEYVRNVVSPRSGRRIEDAEEIRCEGGAEFDAGKIDPEKKRFQPLIYATYLYSLDASVGRVMQRIEELGLASNTIFLFTADNGATSGGCNLPFRGSKHTLWDGGVHVPAAVWWPRNFDANTAPYTPGNNRYTGFIGYLDLYPTLLSMAGQSCLAQGLDGMDCWKNLKDNTNPRPGMENAYHWMWSDHGMIRTNGWKLFYSESAKRVELYDLAADVGEETNVAAAHPEVRDTLIGMHRKWLADNGYAVSYLPVDKTRVGAPAPKGDVLEIRATQTRDLGNAHNEGVYLRLAKSDGWGEKLGGYVECGDQLEYDIYVCEDSDISQGISYCAGAGWKPFLNPRNGLNQDGASPQLLEHRKGTWTRQAVGIGNMCPRAMVVSYVALQSRKAGTHHFYLDNVVVRRSDGTIRNVVWASRNDSGPLIVRHRNRNYNKLADALGAKGFPFSAIDITATQVDAVTQAKPKEARQPADEGASWTPLFNGKDLSGWSVQCRPKDRDKGYWRVDAGSILVDSVGHRDHNYIWLMSDGEYSDFRLKLKFQIHKGISGNSGVQIRSRYDTAAGWLDGPQLDIHPPNPMRAGLIYDETRGTKRWICPSLEKGNHRIPAAKTNPKVKLVYGEGTWNEMEIVAQGTHITCIVNGEVASDYDGAGVLDDADHRDHNVGLRGHVALQLHSRSELKARFRDIRIQERTSK